MTTMIFALVAALILGAPDKPDEASSPKWSFWGFLGYGMSAFDDDFMGDMDQGSYIPGGFQTFYHITPTIQLGAEYAFTLSKFSTDDQVYIGGYYYDYELEASITAISVLCKILLTDEIFARGGVGSYSGSGEATIEGETEKGDLEAGLGFNVGGGYIAQVSDNFFLGGEGTYHIVSLEPEDESEDYSFNHWCVKVVGGTTF